LISPMPTFFFGHGNPMNALSKNSYTETWASIGKSIPRPTAMLAVQIGSGRRIQIRGGSYEENNFAGTFNI
jgi:hypothetical protein